MYQGTARYAQDFSVFIYTIDKTYGSMLVNERPITPLNRQYASHSPGLRATSATTLEPACVPVAAPSPPTAANRPLGYGYTRIRGV